MEQYDEKKALAEINSSWISVINRIQAFVDKQYLCQLPETEVCEIDDKYESAAPVTLYKLDRLVFKEEEGVLDKLVNVYSAMHGLNANVFLLLHGNADGSLDFYVGCRSRVGVDVTSLMLKSSLEGNFPGMELTKQSESVKNAVLDNCIPLGYERMNLASVTVSPGFRKERRQKDVDYIQGMEKFIDSMKGREYSAIFMAEPVNREDVIEKRGIYEDFITELSKYHKISLGFNKGESLALSKSLSDGSSKTVTDGISSSVSTNVSKSIGKTRGRSHNSSANFFVASFGSGSHHDTSKTETEGETRSGSKSHSQGDTTSHTLTEGSTDTETKGMSCTLNMENRRISDLIDKMDYELEKLEKANSYGLWDMAVYVLSEEKVTAVAAANGIRSLVIGDDSGKAESFMNVWDNTTATFRNKGLDRIMAFLHSGMHPVFQRRIEGSAKEQFFSPSVMVSGDILPSIMGFPLRSVSGLTVMSIADFGRNVVTDDIQKQGNRKIKLGQIAYMGKCDGTPVELIVNSLSSHAFICGAPGSGKSNTVYKMIYELSRISPADGTDEDEMGRSYGKVGFLVIEPAKGEYKHEFSKMPGINIYTTGIRDQSMLRINPFEFPYKSMDIQEHIERLKNIIMACWPLTAAMPAILSDALEQSYANVGWDLNNSVFVGEEPQFPDFYEVLKALPQIINNSSYSADTKGDYTGALVTRVASLTKGIASRVFVKNTAVPDRKLFDENTIIDISNIGSSETRSLIMGILIMRLENYRRSTADAANYPLRHITVLEEAHHLLPRQTTNAGAAMGSDLQGKSVEVICNAIAELRSMGEGIVIVDQTPGRVADAAVSNTSTKILMRLPGSEDIKVAAASVGLDEKQAAYIPMLAQGNAVVKQGNWLDPVVTIIDKAPRTYFRRILGKFDYEDEKAFRGELLEKIFAVVKRNNGNKKIAARDSDRILRFIEKCDDLPDHAKSDYKELWMSFSEYDSGERKAKLSILVMRILRFQDGIHNVKPKLKKVPDAKGTLTTREKQEIQNWRSELVDTLSYYVRYDKDLESELLLQIYDYCIKFQNDKLLRLAAHFAAKMETE